MSNQNNSPQEKKGVVTITLMLILIGIGVVLVWNTFGTFFFLERTYKDAILSAKASSNYFAELSLMLSLDLVNNKMLVLFISSMLLFSGVYFFFNSFFPSRSAKENDIQPISFPSQTPGIIMILTAIITIIIISFRVPKIEFVNDKGEQKFASVTEKIDSNTSKSFQDTVSNKVK